MSNVNQLLLANFSELSLHECGREKCQPGKIIKLDIKPYHLIHYVLYGSGTFIYQDKTYYLKKGDVFYIPPQETATYFPNDEDPWIYVWIGFSGQRSDQYLDHLKIDSSNPIYHDNKDLELKPLFNELADRYNHAKFLNIEVLSIFMNILYKMITGKNKQEIILTSPQTHVRMAKQFIENNFQFDIKITDIANALSVNPNYLSNLFRAEIGISTKQYLVEYRIQKACQLLSNGTMLIKDVAKKVGYKNPLYFTSEFTRIKKLSPTKYQNQNSL